MRWPFRRRIEAQDRREAPVDATRPNKGLASRPPAWRDLPPIGLTSGAIARTFYPVEFGESLTTQQDAPVIVTPPSHYISPEGPSGQVIGLTKVLNITFPREVGTAESAALDFEWRRPPVADTDEGSDPGTDVIRSTLPPVASPRRLPVRPKPQQTDRSKAPTTSTAAAIRNLPEPRPARPVALEADTGATGETSVQAMHPLEARPFRTIRRTGLGPPLASPPPTISAEPAAAPSVSLELARPQSLASAKGEHPDPQGNAEAVMEEANPPKIDVRDLPLPRKVQSLAKSVERQPRDHPRALSSTVPVTGSKQMRLSPVRPSSPPAISPRLDRKQEAPPSIVDLRPYRPGLPEVVDKSSLDSPSEAVPHEVRQSLEPLLLEDLSQVRIARGRASFEEAKELNARAFTRSETVHLPAEHGPLSLPANRGLVAHELTHVAQQRRLPSVVEDNSQSAIQLEAQAQLVETAFTERAADDSGARRMQPALRSSSPRTDVAASTRSDSAPAPAKSARATASMSAPAGTQRAPSLGSSILSEVQDVAEQEVPDVSEVTETARETASEVAGAAAGGEAPTGSAMPQDHELKEFAFKMYPHLKSLLRYDFLVETERRASLAGEG